MKTVLIIRYFIVVKLKCLTQYYINLAILIHVLNFGLPLNFNDTLTNKCIILLEYNPVISK